MVIIRAIALSMLTEKLMEQSRLDRLLGYLKTDPHNLRLLRDALALAVENPGLAEKQLLASHLEQYTPEDPESQAHAACLFLQLQDFEAASRYGDDAIQAGVIHPSVVYNTAFGHFHCARLDRADELLAKITSAPDATEDALALHGRVLHHLERIEEALDLLHRACANGSARADSRGLLALLQYENGDNPNALQTALETLADDSDQLDALVACASAHFEQGNIQASRKTWLYTVETHSTCGRAWSGLAELEFHELEFGNAEKHLKTAVTYMPNHIGTWHLLAWIYILSHDCPNARKALEAAYSLDRNFGETHGGFAVLDAMEGNDEKARLNIRRAVRLNPQVLSVEIAKIVLLEKAGKSADAQLVMDALLQRERMTPSGPTTGKALLQHWLATHGKRQPDARPTQH